MKVAVIMGSKSDLPVLQPTIDTLKDFGIEVEAVSYTHLDVYKRQVSSGGAAYGKGTKYFKTLSI